MHEAIAGEVWNASSILKESLDQQRSKTRAHAVSGKLPPRDDAEYQAFCRLDYQRAVTKAIQSIETRDLCSLSAVDQPEMKPATWNLTANIAMPNLSSLSRRVQRLEMESEMTRKVVQLVQARAVAVTGELKLPAGFAASGCKTGHWLVEKSADGQSVTLRFSAPIDWGEKMKGAKIPLQFTLHDSPQPASPPPPSQNLVQKTARLGQTPHR